MDLPDSYKTVSIKGDIEIKIEGSRFIGLARPCHREKEAEDRLTAIRKKYYDATHYCFAYRLGRGKDAIFRWADAGEPAGTAGKPIYSCIEGRDLTDILVVVVRYFGGTKLGTGGLARAYAEAANKAIEASGVIEKFITRTFIMRLQFPDYNIVEREIRQIGGTITGAEFTDIVGLKVQIRVSRAEELKLRLKEVTSGRIVIM